MCVSQSGVKRGIITVHFKGLCKLILSKQGLVLVTRKNWVALPKFFRSFSIFLKA